MKSHPTYELLEEIGRGSAATVYRAYDTALKRNVAIKELSEKFQDDPRQMEQFWEEAQFLANLKHDNIVQIHGLDKERGWIIMELMKGSLDAKVAEGPLPADLVRSVLRQTLAALQALHASKKFHGGVRPGNMLINEKGRVKLSDSAGIALAEELRRPTGSAKYLAPELLNPEFGEVSTQVDLYCLGLSALEMLKGPSFDRLFKGVGGGAADPELGWMRWHSSATEVLPPIQELMPSAPPDLARVIDKLLKKNVAERYATAADALKDLEDKPLVLVEPAKTGPKPPIALSPGKGGVQAVAGLAPPKPPPPRPPVKPPGPATAKWKKPALYGGIALAVLLVALMLLALSGGSKPVEVQVVTTPPGVSVRINGVDQKETTPAKYSFQQGENKVVLKLAGQEKKLLIKVKADKLGVFDPPDAAQPQQTVAVADGKAKEPLKIAFGTAGAQTITLRITSNPPGAKIYINKQEQKDKLTDTMVTFAADPNEKTAVVVTVAKDGYEPATDSVFVKAGEETKKHFDLKKVKVARLGKLQLRTEPAGVEVYIDGDDEPQPKKTKDTFDTNDAYDVPTTKYKVKLVLRDKKTGAITSEEPIEVDPSRPGTDKLELILTWEVFIATKPSGATVSMIATKPPGETAFKDIAPKNLGVTDTTIRVPVSRPFKLKLTLAGYQTLYPEVDPTQLTKRELKYPLKPIEDLTRKTLNLDLGGGIQMMVARIDPGKFLMGSPFGEEKRQKDENQHEVEITEPYYLGVYPVTQAQYRHIMGKNPSWFSAQGKGKDEVANLNTDDFPVETVSWEEAEEFCVKVSALAPLKENGWVVNLPTEAEWEYACRAGTTTAFHCGDTLSFKQANIADDPKKPFLNRTTKVGSYAPNAWGLYDMHGNVKQWCKDWYGAYNPSIKKDPLGSPNGTVRVQRGGCWNFTAEWCRAASRSAQPPGFRNFGSGFRVVVWQATIPQFPAPAQAVERGGIGNP
jgi:formylglycine-generating enzyme required for sulfatase activity